MKQNFKLLEENIDTKIVLTELSKFLETHEWSDLRSKNIKYHNQTKHISLRDHKLNKQNSNIEYYRNSGNIITNRYAAPYFTKTFSLLKSFEDKIGGQLERVMIVALDGNATVKAHIDLGSYYSQRDRYHLAVTTKNSINFCGDESQIYKTGELWWFDNKKLHSVENKTQEVRIHLIFDILKKKKDWKRKTTDMVEKIFFNIIAKLL